MAKRKAAVKKDDERVPLFHARLLADIHLNEWGDFARRDEHGLNSRLVLQGEALEELLLAPGVNGRPRVLIVAGDLVHKHGTVTPAVQWALKNFFTVAAKNYDDVIVIPGNHDYELKSEGGHFLHALVGLNYNDVQECIDVVDFPTVKSFHVRDACFEDPKYNVGFVPWVRDKTKFRASIEEVANDGAMMLIAHAAIDGFKTDNGWTYEGGMKKSVLMPSKFDAVFLGDFHTRQSNENVFYIGAPYQMNWNDSGDDARGALDVIVYDNGEEHNIVEVTSVESTHPKFVKVDNLDEAREQKAAGNFVRLTNLTKPLSKKDQIDGIAVEYAPPASAKQRLEVKPDCGVIDVLDAYLDSVKDEIEFDAELLRQVATEVVSKVDQSELVKADSTASLSIQTIEAENFLSYSKLGPIDVQDRGIVLIDGENLDDADAQSNGAGKSTIVEAIFYALFGDTLRKCSAAEVVKRDSKGGTFVRLTAILRDGRSATIVRARKYKGLAEGLSVIVDGKTISTSGDIQKLLNDLTGITPALFKQVVVFGQEINSVFASSTDAERKSLLENICSGGQFEPCYAEAKQAVDECEIAIRDVEHSIDNIERSIKLQQQTLDAEKERENSYFERCRVESQRVDSEIVSQKKTLENASKREIEAKQKIEQFEEAISQYDGEHDEDELRRQRDELRDESAEVNAELKAAQSRLRSISHNLENVNLEVGMKCENCQQTVTEEAREAIFQTLRSEQAEFLDLETKFLDRKAEIDAEIVKLDERLSVIKKNKDEKREKEREFDRISREHDAAVTETMHCKRRIKELEARLAELKDEKQNPHTAAVEKYENDIAKNRKLLDKKTVSRDQLNEWLPYFKEVARLFGNQGLKTFLFDSLAPKITLLANDALRILSSGTISVEMTTERTKAGAEKISLVVNNSLGAASYRGNSGGQKRKVDLALCWAISQLVEGHVNLFFIDEAFDGLDATASERVSELLSKRVRDRGTIFVITHRSEFRDQFQNVWTATRKNGDSTLKIGD